MRILYNDEKGEVSVLEIAYATYDKHLYYDDGQGKTLEAEGILFSDIDQDTWVLPNVNQSECEKILLELFTNGIYNFRKAFLDWRIYSETEAHGND